MTIEQVVDLYSRGRYAEARAEAISHLTSESSERILRIIGLIDFRFGDFGSSKGFISRAIEVDPKKALVNPWFSAEMLTEAVAARPDFSWARYHLGVVLFERRRFGEATAELDKVKDAAEVGEHLVHAANELRCEIIRRTLPREKAIAEIGHIIAREAGAVSEAARALYSGMIQHADGRWSEADASFARAVELEPTEMYQRIPAAVGAVTYANSVRDRNAAAERYYKELDAVAAFEPLKKTPTDRYVVMCSADARYFRMFAETFVSSILVSCGDVPIHINIVNPDAETVTELARIRDLLPGIRLSVSETLYEGEDSRAYFATSRFLVAPRILTVYGLPLLITDIDAVFIKDPRAGVLELWNTDVGVKRNPSGNLEFPWTEIFATYMLFSARAMTYTTLFEIGCYFFEQFGNNKRKNSWWIDQNAIRYAASVGGARGVTFGEIVSSKLNGVIETNQAMEEKSKFISRVKSRFPIEKAQLAFS